MNPLWSPEQQAWLKALGHRVLVLAGDESGTDALVGESIGDARPAVLPSRGEGHQGVPEGALDAAADRPRPPPPVAPAEGEAKSRRGAPVDVAAPSPPRPVPSRVPNDALERALLRATGQRTRSEARAVLQRLGVDMSALRGNPAAKRTLWLKMRPLRPRLRP